MSDKETPNAPINPESCGSWGAGGEHTVTKTKHLIRVAAAFPWPNNHSDHPRSHSASKKVGEPGKIGDVIFGIGSPREPDRHWHCGTDVVWPVYELNGMQVEPDHGVMPYVCRHQILAGD